MGELSSYQFDLTAKTIPVKCINNVTVYFIRNSQPSLRKIDLEVFDDTGNIQQVTFICSSHLQVLCVLDFSYPEKKLRICDLYRYTFVALIPGKKLE